MILYTFPLPQDHFFGSGNLIFPARRLLRSSTELLASPCQLLFQLQICRFLPFPHSPVPFAYPSITLVRTARLLLIFRRCPPPCCRILPERAQVLPGGNDCYLQDTLHITSTPFGVFRPSSFCCVSHFTPWARISKDQSLLFTGEARQATGLLEVETFFLPRMSGSHSRPSDTLHLSSQYTHQQ